MSKRKRYSARVEAVQCAAEAIRRKQAGETMSAIYDNLIERSEITMALRTFMQWINRLESEAVYVPLDPKTQRQPAAIRHSASEQIGSPVDESVKARPASGAPGFKHARIGVALAPLPNMEPDRKALLGDDD